MIVKVSKASVSSSEYDMFETQTDLAFQYKKKKKTKNMNIYVKYLSTDLKISEFR